MPPWRAGIPTPRSGQMQAPGAQNTTALDSLIAKEALANGRGTACDPAATTSRVLPAGVAAPRRHHRPRSGPGRHQLMLGGKRISKQHQVAAETLPHRFPVFLRSFNLSTAPSPRSWDSSVQSCCDIPPRRRVPSLNVGTPSRTRSAKPSSVLRNRPSSRRTSTQSSGIPRVSLRIWEIPPSSVRSARLTRQAPSSPAAQRPSSPASHGSQTLALLASRLAALLRRPRPPSSDRRRVPLSSRNPVALRTH
jgi:hypothetical protein